MGYFAFLVALVSLTGIRSAGADPTFISQPRLAWATIQRTDQGVRLVRPTADGFPILSERDSYPDGICRLFSDQNPEYGTRATAPAVLDWSERGPEFVPNPSAPNGGEGEDAVRLSREGHILGRFFGGYLLVESVTCDSTFAPRGRDAVAPFKAVLSWSVKTRTERGFKLVGVLANGRRISARGTYGGTGVCFLLNEQEPSVTRPLRVKDTSFLVFAGHVSPQSLVWLNEYGMITGWHMSRNALRLSRLEVYFDDVTCEY